jgi:hypothetical protein
MKRPGFRAGVEDYRAGRVRFDEFPYDWAYEWGRQFAAIAPLNMEIWRGDGSLSPHALHLARVVGFEFKRRERQYSDSIASRLRRARQKRGI